MSRRGRRSRSDRTKDMCTLFVTVKGSKLPQYITGQHLREHFEEFEDEIVNSMVYREKETMESKGYGFIKFTSSLAASEAMRTLQGSLLRGKFPLLLKSARRKSPATSSVYGSGSESNSDSDSDSSNTTLYVGVFNSKFPNYVNSGHLRQHFVEFDHCIKDAMIIRDAKTKETKGYGFVKFSSHAAAKLAMKQLRGSKLDGKFKLFINLKERKGSRSSIPSVSVSRASSTSDLSSCDLEDDTEQSGSDCTLYVSVYNSKFPNYINSRHLAAHFSEFDEHIKRAMIMRDMKTKESKGFGIVTFSSQSVAERAMKKLRGSKLNGKFSLYIKKDEMKQSSLLSPAESEKSLVQLSGTTEELLYLRYRFYTYTTAAASDLKKSLPAQLVLRDNILFLFGTDNARRISTNQIHASRLIQNLLSRVFRATWDPSFVDQLCNSILPPINASEEDILCILTHRQEQGPNLVSFTVQIFSHSLKIIQEYHENLNELQPQSKLYQLRPEYKTLDGLTDVFQTFGKDHGTRIEKEAGDGVRIHGLKVKDVQNCWTALKSFVDSQITVTHNLNVGFWEAKYLQSKCINFIHTLEREGCKVQFPVLTDKHHQGKVKVVLVGKIKSTKQGSERIKEQCSKCHVQSVKVSCNTKYLLLWLRQWKEFVEDHTKKNSDLMIEYQHQPQSAANQVVDFTIVGTNSTAVIKARNELVHKQDGSVDKLSMLDVVLTTTDFNVVSTNLEECVKKLKQTHKLLVVELDSKRNVVKLLTTSISPFVLSMLEKELSSFVASKTSTVQKSMTKEVRFKDEVIGSLLTSKNKHLAKLEQQGVRFSVSVQPQPEAFVLKLSGSGAMVKQLEVVIDSVAEELSGTVKHAELVLSGHYLPITSMDSFKTFCSKLLKELHTKCTCYINVGGDTRRQVFLTSKSGHFLTLQIAVGHLCDEKVDAIVIPAELRDKTMTNTEMNYEYFRFLQRKSLTTGDVACVDSGTFPSKKSLHVLLPRNCERVEKQFDFTVACSKIISCALTNQFGSLSFPALGVDEVHHVPPTVCIETLLNCVDNHCLYQDDTTLHTVRIVITQDLVSTFLSCFDKHTFRTVHKGGISSGVGSQQLTSPPPQYEWYWEDDQKQFVPYSQDVCTSLTDTKLNCPDLKFYFLIRCNSYSVDVSTMTQKNLETGFIRKVMCKEVPSVRSVCSTSSISKSLETQHKVQWYYQDDNRKFTAYSQADSVTIEEMYQKVDSVKKYLTIQSRVYTFDFEKMKQENVSTKHRRDIKREEIPYKKVEKRAECESSPCIINLRGPIDNHERAKDMVEDKLKSLATFKNVPLPVTSTPALKQKLQSIARRHSVSASIRDDNKAKLSSPHQRRFSQVFRIEGAEHLVDKAVTEVQGEIIEFQSQSSSGSLSQMDEHYPPEWDFQTRTSELFDLNKHSHEWIQVTSLFRETMPDAKICTVKRIQNKRLWGRYKQQKDWIHEKNNGVVNEKELWHGSRKSSADNIYASEEGFDMRHSSEGLWGRANYFAEKASYSDKYAYTSTDGSKELLLAKVLTGDSFESQPNSTLRMPPEKPKSSQSSNIQLKQLRYDSVTGETAKCRVYMTYANDMAYPAYLICYTPPSETNPGVRPLRTAHPPQTAYSVPVYPRTQTNQATQPQFIQSVLNYFGGKK